MSRDWIRQLRLKHGLTQTQLAKKALLAAPRLSRIEAGYCDMTEVEVQKLAKALDVSEPIVRGEAPSIKTETPQTAEAPNHAAIPNAQLPATHAPSPAPVVYSLSDPTHYRQLPDRSILELNGSNTTQHLGAFRTALQEAEKVLHTSRVPADIWRQWREFEKQLREKLRLLAAS